MSQLNAEDVTWAAMFLASHPIEAQLKTDEDREAWAQANNIREAYRRTANGWGQLFSL